MVRHSRNGDGKHIPARCNMTRTEIQEMFTAVKWCRFPLDFLLIMSPLEAIVLAFLINKAYLTKAEIRADGWFYCAMKLLTKRLHISTDQQTRLVKRLKQKKLIRIKVEGLPARRFFWIDFARIRTKIVEARCEDDE